MIKAMDANNHLISTGGEDGIVYNYSLRSFQKRSHIQLPLDGSQNKPP